MGITASMFFSSNDSEKQTLSKRIVPTDEQFQEQQERWNELADHLIEDLTERVGYQVKTWLQGSYKFGTQIRPLKQGDEFDIDLGVYFVWPGEPDDEDIAPKSLKEDVQQSLKAFAQSNSDDVEEVTEPKPRCCRIRYPGNFHVDVPTYHLGLVGEKKSLATEYNSWEKSDPKAFYVWFKNYLDEPLRAKARRHIRYLKSWVGLNFEDTQDRPSSVLLTVLVTEAIKKIREEKLSSDDDGFKQIVAEILVRLEKNPVVVNPVNKDERLSDRLSEEAYDLFLEKLSSLDNLSSRALAAEDIFSACDIWSEAFQHFFPAPDEKDIVESQAATTAKNLPAIMRFDPVVKVSASQKDDPTRTWSGTNRIGPIPKKCNIKFSLQNDWQLPHGAEVYWIVRNNGKEAEYVNDLGHLAGVGINRNETSAYNGKHYMDCVVKLSGNLIGYKRVLVEIAGNPIPKRNPLRRPAYTKLMGRR